MSDHQKLKGGDIVVVGIGASAGGLEALQDLISHLPEQLENIALVIAQHLSPTYKSMLVQLLSRQTKLPVLEIKNGGAIQANTIYITPPDSEVTISGNVFSLTKPSVSAGPKPSIDAFFHSLSQDKKEKSIGIILSGTGSDGAYGVRSIKAAGGITIAQEPQTARYNGMPIAAIETGQVDLVLSPDKIGEEIKEILYHPQSFLSKSQLAEADTGVERVLKLLSHRAGIDFTNYKPSTILRRLEKRINELKITNIDDYVKFAETHPAELDALFNTILIGVTTFFRDPDAYLVLEKHLSELIRQKPKGGPIRIWIAGCATGEEAYSLALIVAKIVDGQFSEYNIQIFATDIDEKAITYARKGLYPETSFKDVPQDLMERYTIKKGDQREVVKSIRQLILFSRHDVTSNPPFLKLDLISCRNLLIYFGQPLQQQVIPIFHYSLNPEGHLFLGKSETVGQFTDLFNTIDSKAKIFQRKRGNKISAVRFLGFGSKLVSAGTPPVKKDNSKITISDMLKETFFNSFDYPYVVIDGNMDVVQINGDVRMYLSINPGMMNNNLLKLGHKDLQIDLRALVSDAIKNNQTSRGEIRKLHFFEHEYFVRIVVKPILFAPADNTLFVVIFENYELNSKMLIHIADQYPTEADPRVLELEHELNSIKEHMQTFIEELETANEELQSLNEELQSSNEELQSTNEELETSNEELQSTNEELQIAYTQLKSASEEIEQQARHIKQSEANLRALLNNTLQSFILINKDYKIIAFNNTANQKAILLFNKIMKVGESIIDFQPEGGLEKFHREFNKALKGQMVTGEMKIDVKGGQPRWMRYTFTPVEDDNHEIHVISYSMLDTTEQKRIERELMESERLVNSILNSVDVAISVVNEQGAYVKVNRAYSDLYGYDESELIGQLFTITLPEDHRQLALEQHKSFLDGSPESSSVWEVVNKKGNLFKAKMTMSRMVTEDRERFKITLVVPFEN